MGTVVKFRIQPLGCFGMLLACTLNFRRWPNLVRSDLRPNLSDATSRARASHSSRTNRAPERIGDVGGIAAGTINDHPLTNGVATGSASLCAVVGYRVTKPTDKIRA